MGVLFSLALAGWRSPPAVWPTPESAPLAAARLRAPCSAPLRRSSASSTKARTSDAGQDEGLGLSGWQSVVGPKLLDLWAAPVRLEPATDRLDGV